MFDGSLRSHLLGAAMGTAIVSCAAGCSSEEAGSVIDEMVMVDQKTGEAFVLPVADSFPVAHPKTGKMTLMPALYCPTCEKWYPTPPPEVLNRQPGAGLCPKSKTPLTADGPWPDATDNTED